MLTLVLKISKWQKPFHLIPLHKSVWFAGHSFILAPYYILFLIFFTICKCLAVPEASTLALLSSWLYTIFIPFSYISSSCILSNLLGCAMLYTWRPCLLCHFYNPHMILVYPQQCLVLCSLSALSGDGRSDLFHSSFIWPANVICILKVKYGPMGPWYSNYLLDCYSRP